MISDDLRHAVRALARRPGFLLLGVVALGLGLACTTLVFSMINTFLLRDPPGVHPTAALVEIGRGQGERGFDSSSYPDFLDLRVQASSLDRVFAYRIGPAYVQGAEEAQLGQAQLVSGDYFEALGVRAAQGNLLGSQHDGAPGANPVVVASQRAFERWFEGDAGRVGSQVMINGASYTLIGVTDPEFKGHLAGYVPDFYMPLSMAAAMHMHTDDIRESRGSRWLSLGARLAPGVSLEAAQVELDGIAARLARSYPDSNADITLNVAPLRPVSNFAWGVIAGLSGALLGLCAAVILLACFNLGGVMLARGQVRRAEFAVCAALGAGRARLTRQLLIEAVLVGLAAAAFALLLAWVGRNLLNALSLPLPVPLDLSLAIDGYVVAALVTTTLGVAMLFGLWPALQLSAAVRGTMPSLREGSESRAPRQRGRRVLIAVQAALTVCLLLFAVLVLRAVQQSATVDTGFRLANVSMADFDLEPLGIASGDGAGRMESLADRLRAMPGIEAAGFASLVPLTMSSMSFGNAHLPGQQDEGHDLLVNTVGEGFLDTVGIAVRGRGIERTDDASAEKVAVVNRRLAQRLFGTDDVLGKSFEIGEDEPETVRIVGVVPDGRYSSLNEEGSSFAFLAAPQWDRGEFTLFLRSRLPAAELRETLQREAQGEFPGLPAPRLGSFEQATHLSILPQLVLGGAASALGVLALILAATGLYGVLAFQVASRRREFGVRMALGAPGARIASQVGRGLLWWVVPGTLLGVAMGQGAAMVVGQVLGGLGGFDAAALAVVLLAFVLMAVLAAGAPLLRMLRLRPSDALRSE